MRKSRIGLTILMKMIRIAVLLITYRRKTRRLETINYRRNAENLSDLSVKIYFGSDNLIVFIKLILHFRRFRPSFVTELRDYIIEKNDFYFGMFLPIII
jgi:hypothetical protein